MGQQPDFVAGTAVLIVGGLLVSASARAAETIEGCSAVLVPNDLKVSNAQTSDDQFWSAMCGDWYTSHKDTVDSAAGASFLIDVIPVGVDGKYASTSSSMSRTQYCAQKSHRVALSSRNRWWSSIVPNEARKEWTWCVERVLAATGPHPIKLNVDYTIDGATVAARYDANYGGPEPILTAVSSTNMNCGFPGRKPIPSQGVGLAWTCKWKTEDADNDALIVSTSRGDEVARLSRRIPPLVTAIIETHTFSRVPNNSSEICSDPVRTLDMHEWKADKGDGRCNQTSDDHKWCKGTYGATVSPKSGGLLSAPSIKPDDSDSCRWNDISRHSWFEKVGDAYHAEFWAGGHSCTVRVCATETMYKDVDNKSEGGSLTLSRGSGFVADLPSNATAVIRLKWHRQNEEAQNEEALAVGSSNARLTIVAIAKAGDVTKYSYRVNR